MAKEKFSNRIRFNWGYHDGAFAHRNHINRPDSLTVSDIVAKHQDKIYAWGYRYGYEDSHNGDYNKNSDNAWQTALTKNQVKN